MGRKSRWLLYIFGTLVAVYLILPTFIVIPMSFSDSLLMKFPPERFSLRWYQAFFSSPAWTSAFWLSLKLATTVMVASTCLGVPAALGLVRGKFPGKAAIHAFLISPMIVPFVVTGLAMYYFYSSLKIVGNPYCLFFSHVCLATPIVIVIVSATLQNFDQMLERAAQILGATPFQTFMKVTLPIIRPGVLTGAIFAFIVSFDEVVIASFIGGFRSTTLPKRMFDNVRDEMDPTVAAISTLLVILSVMLLVVINYLNRRASRISGR